LPQIAQELFRRSRTAAPHGILRVILAILAKPFAHQYNLETIALNNIIASIIVANVFILGFLLSGVTSDYKKGERLPL